MRIKKPPAFGRDIVAEDRSAKPFLGIISDARLMASSLLTRIRARKQNNSGRGSMSTNGAKTGNLPDIPLFFAPILQPQSGDFSEMFFIICDQDKIHGQSGRRDQ
jgi:hypothetical protein